MAVKFCNREMCFFWVSYDNEVTNDLFCIQWPTLFTAIELNTYQRPIHYHAISSKKTADLRMLYIIGFTFTLYAPVFTH